MIELEDSTFDEAIAKSKKCMVYFWAPWCSPCKRFGPIIDEVQKENEIHVFKVNTDENLEKASKFSVSSMPTVVLFEDGMPVKTIIGAMPKHLFLKEIDQWI